MIHEYTITRIISRAATLWGVDAAQLAAPVGRCNTRRLDECNLHRMRWACIAGALELGVPRKACQAFFGASESTVARARSEAPARDVARLVGR